MCIIVCSTPAYSRLLVSMTERLGHRSPITEYSGSMALLIGSVLYFVYKKLQNTITYSVNKMVPIRVSRSLVTKATDFGL